METTIIYRGILGCEGPLIKHDNIRGYRMGPSYVDMFK